MAVAPDDTPDATAPKGDSPETAVSRALSREERRERRRALQAKVGAAAEADGRRVLAQVGVASRWVEAAQIEARLPVKLGR